MGSNQSKANSSVPPNYTTLYPQNTPLNYQQFGPPNVQPFGPPNVQPFGPPNYQQFGPPNVQPFGPPNVQPFGPSNVQPTPPVITSNSSNAMQQLKDYVKSQVKAESLRRAGVQGADPWGNADELVPPTTQHTIFPNGYSSPYTTLGATATSSAVVAGQEPEARVLPEPQLPAFLTQPLTLLNKGSANGGPQALNYEVCYYAPVQETIRHREFINCFEDCCEDVCENCFLNSFLDCSRVSRLFSVFSRTNETTGQTEYMVMEAGAAAQTASPYATTAPTGTTTIGNIAN
jgi:hypothetical protein